MRLAADCRLLICTNDHEHVVGTAQVQRIVGTPCPWCRGTLRAAQHEAQQPPRNTKVADRESAPPASPPAVRRGTDRR